MACTKPSTPVALVDWLAYTAPADIPLDELLPGSDRLDWVELDHGIRGYRTQRRAGNVAVYADGQADMGQHVIITGSGCRELEAAGLLDDDFLGGWSGLLGWILNNGWHITRLDLAVDDRAGQLDIDELEQAVTNEQVVSLWRSSRSTQSYKTGKGKQGTTLYFGSRQSAIFCRIYDKKAERAAAGEDVEELSSWVRVELEMKDETATAAAGQLAEGKPAGTLIAGLLRRYLQFKQPAVADSNKRRWLLLASWAAFLGSVEPITLSIAPAVRTLDTVRAWLTRQVAPALALVVKAAGGDLQDLYDLVSNGAGRLKPRHLALLPIAT